MMRVDEALLMRWKDRLCDEIDEIYHEENWTPQHAKSMKEMLSSVEKIKCAKEMDESGMQGKPLGFPIFFIFQNNNQLNHNLKKKAPLFVRAQQSRKDSF